MFRPVPFVLGLAVIALLALAAPASAQTQVVATRLTTTVNDFPDDLERNSTRSSGFFDVQFCYDQGGFNPQGGQITLTITNTAPPEWATVTNLPPAAIVFAPPTGPAPAADCMPSTTIQFEASILGTAPYDTTAPLTFTVTASGGTDVGTYMIPPAATATLNLDTSAAPPVDIIPTDGPGSTDTDGAGAGESPATAPMAIVISVLALVAMRRREN